jgi:hypothetical protein
MRRPGVFHSSLPCHEFALNVGDTLLEILCALIAPDAENLLVSRIGKVAQVQQLHCVGGILFQQLELFHKLQQELLDLLWRVTLQFVFDVGHQELPSKVRKCLIADLSGSLP